MNERDTDSELSSNRRQLLQAVGATGLGTAVGTRVVAPASASDATATDSGRGFEVRESVELQAVEPDDLPTEPTETSFGALSAGAQSVIEAARADGRYELSGRLPSELYGTRYVRRDGQLYRVLVATADAPPSER